MKRLMLAGLVLSLTAIWSVRVLAEEDPWKDVNKKGDAKEGTPEAVAPEGAAGAVDFKKDLPAPLFERTVGKVEAKLALAEKVMALYAKEMEKEEAKRNEKMATGYKVQAAQFYMGASLEARKAATSFTKPEQKTAMASQYEKPSMEKAIAIYLELADKALKDKDYKTAIAYYQRVLQLDKENAAAKDGLAKIKQELAAQAEANKKHAGQGGGDDDQVPGTQDHTQTGRDPNNGTGKGAGGWGR